MLALGLKLLELLHSSFFDKETLSDLPKLPVEIEEERNEELSICLSVHLLQLGQGMLPVELNGDVALPSDVWQVQHDLLGLVWLVGVKRLEEVLELI